jgi:RimJ/RimL family protein N-acetyltransferase
MTLVPVEESAALRFPEDWPPPLFSEDDAVPDERRFVVVERGEPLGMIALGPPGARVEVGYAVREVHRGAGVASRALAQVVKLAFADAHTVELYARTRPSSAASIRVLQKNGFAPAAEREGFVIFTRRR